LQQLFKKTIVYRTVRKITMIATDLGRCPHKFRNKITGLKFYKKTIFDNYTFKQNYYHLHYINVIIKVKSINHSNHGLNESKSIHFCFLCNVLKIIGKNMNIKTIIRFSHEMWNLLGTEVMSKIKILQ
jgi:hypothetical protein